MTFSVEADFSQPVEQVYAYLADPAHRPQWQSSLRKVVPITDGPPVVGSRWYDVTWAGPRPLMEITVDEPGRVWAERGSWHGLGAELTLHFEVLAFEATGETGTRVRAVVETTTPGWRRPIGWGIRALGPAAVRADLALAVKRLSKSGTHQ